MRLVAYVSVICLYFFGNQEWVGLEAAVERRFFGKTLHCHETFMHLDWQQWTRRVPSCSWVDGLRQYPLLTAVCALAQDSIVKIRESVLNAGWWPAIGGFIYIPWSPENGREYFQCFVEMPAPPRVIKSTYRCCCSACWTALCCVVE